MKEPCEKTYSLKAVFYLLFCELDGKLLVELFDNDGLMLGFERPTVPKDEGQELVEQKVGPLVVLPIGFRLLLVGFLRGCCLGRRLSASSRLGRIVRSFGQS